MGLYLLDKDRNFYLFVAVDPFSKWVETYVVPLLYSWRAAEFLYNDVVTRWEKLCLDRQWH